MGALCSRSSTEHDQGCKEDAAGMVRSPRRGEADGQLGASARRHRDDVAAARSLIDAHDSNIAALDPALRLTRSRSIADGTRFGSVQDYLGKRSRVLRLEKTLDFDYRCRAASTREEQLADAIIQRLKREDQATVYDAAPPRGGFGGQQHPRFPGDHFLSNASLIDQTKLFQVARKMPKGAHLHIHFNACLLPHVLLDIAKGMDRMFITSDVPLVPDNDFENFNKCEMQFSIMSPDKERPGDLFSPAYQGRQTMRYHDFLQRFPRHYTKARADEWLLGKLIFHEEEAHNSLQTASGAWEKFNGRTRMMKGLFNYETAYRKYTRLCLEDFIKDNIQYAEIRPNFMTSNQLFHDDGTGPIDNWGIMSIIITEVERFQADVESTGGFFGGLKVIYCTPRSFRPEQIKTALDECLEFKKRWPQWIAGFDLVGEEAKGRPIKDFIHELLEFQDKCRASRLEIPFLFHCGETLDMGTDTDGNLVDALLLNSKRIGHGFALSKHPYIMQHIKERDICLELCPISNEILGLTPRVGGHAMYQLLANNVHCTVSSDNGTLFRSSLSHDFYQVMVGKGDMSLYGWKQLILWSLEHSCLDAQEAGLVLGDWEQRWREFVREVVDVYGED